MVCATVHAGPALAQPFRSVAPIVGSGPILLLPDAVAMARAQNRPLQAIRLDVEKAALDAAAFRTKRRPVFDVSGRNGTLLAPFDFIFPAGTFGVFPSTGPIPPEDATVRNLPGLKAVVFASVTQPLSQLHRIGLGLNAMELQQEVAREKVRAREHEVATTVKKLYYGIVLAEAGLGAQLDMLSYYEELDRLMRQYLDQQVVLASDYLAVRAGLARQQHQQLMLQQSSSTYREQLNATLGRSLDEPFTVSAPEIELATPLDMGAAETQAVAVRPEVRIARLQVRQAEFEWRAARAASIPDINVAFNYIGFYNFQLLPPHIASVGVTGSWEPWDWGRKKRESESKRLSMTQGSLAADEAERLVRLDVRTSARNLDASRALLRAADLARAPVRERVRVALERFKANASLQRDVLQTQADLSEAEQQYQQALAGFLTARAEFERATAID